MYINFNATVKKFRCYEYLIAILVGDHPGGGSRFCYVVSNGDDFNYHSFRDGGEHFSSKINAGNAAHNFVSGLVFASNIPASMGAVAYA